jgi:hypothetical protein
VLPQSTDEGIHQKRKLALLVTDVPGVALSLRSGGQTNTRLASLRLRRTDFGTRPFTLNEFTEKVPEFPSDDMPSLIEIESAR